MPPGKGDFLDALTRALVESAVAVFQPPPPVLEIGSLQVQGEEVGISRLPGAPGSPDQTISIGSYGLWILKARPNAEQEAAWKFIKWLMEPEQQAEWFAGSGYLPVSRDRKSVV